MAYELFTICIEASNQSSSDAGPGDVISNLDCFYSALWIYFLAIFLSVQLAIIIKFYYNYKHNEGISLPDYLWNTIASVIDRSVLKYYPGEFRNKLQLYIMLCGGLYIARPMASIFYHGVKNAFQDQSVNRLRYLFFSIIEVSLASWDVLEGLFIVLLLGCKNEILYIKNSQQNNPLDFTIPEHERHHFVDFLVRKIKGYYLFVFFAMFPTFVFTKTYQLNRNLSRMIFRFASYGLTLGVALSRMKYLFFFEKEMLRLNSQKLQEYSTITIMKQQLAEVKPTHNFFKKLAYNPLSANTDDEKAWKTEYGEKLSRKLETALKNNFMQLSKKVELVRGQNSISIPRNPRDNSTLTKILVIFIIVEAAIIMLYSMSEYIRAQNPATAKTIPLHQILLDYVLAVIDLLSICILPWLTKFLIENQYIFGDDPLRSISESTNVKVNPDSGAFSLRSATGLTTIVGAVTMSTGSIVKPDEEIDASPQSDSRFQTFDGIHRQRTDVDIAL